MSAIKKHIENINLSGRKALSVYLTSGFPNKNNFTDLALRVFDAGADIIEIGIPFSDPLADGPVIQASSKAALDDGINLKQTLKYAGEIKSKISKPVILMGYANPILKYGLKNFITDSLNSGIDGIIVPDVPIEEYDSFFSEDRGILDTILLTTPTSSIERIKTIDSKSSGFVYCVSVIGTTGMRKVFGQDVLNNLQRTYANIEKNKMMIGFGIGSAESVKIFSPYCDGLIVGSAVIKSLFDDDPVYSRTTKLVSELSEVCGKN
ncbi:MAG: tryptophan synthase subunit alpha [bacterium]